MSEEYRNALPEGYIIDTYRIERVLGAGGFGITYLVRELNLDKLFAMKELLPDGIAMRRTGDTSYVESKSQSAEGDFAATRKYFISEARILAKMNHPAVVGVQRLMEANGTCYMVMDYVEGDTLGDHLKKRGGVLSGADEFKQIFYPLMSGLEILHDQGIIHRDIKPGNIMVKPDGSPVLLDFGAATQVQSKTMTITQMLSAGYSPFEQYTSRAKQGPYTDVYALGATMFKCITGDKPDDASDRMYGDRYQSLAENENHVAVYGLSIVTSVDNALKMDAQLRPQTVAEWHQMMQKKEKRSEVSHVEVEDLEVPVDRSEYQTTTPLPIADLDPDPDLDPASLQVEPKQRKKNNSMLIGSLIFGVILLVFGLIMVSVLGEDGKKDQESKKDKAEEIARAKEVVRQEQLERDRQLERQKEIARVKEVEHQKELELEKQRKKALLIGEAAGEKRLFNIGGKNVAFRWCPPTGEEGFMMGSPSAEKDRNSDETQHDVVLTKGFWMGETEVTQGMWKVVMSNNPSWTQKGDDFPVEAVNWEDCQGFLNKVNARGILPKGVKVALPTEAQWEYACRAGARGGYAGDLASMGWYEINSGGTTHPVGQKQANAWGVYDMHGNVREWCADWYDKIYYSSNVAGQDPMGARVGQARVLRGGCWNNDAGGCRSAGRFKFWQAFRSDYVGFRLSLQVESR
jgi:formylglycine-generating enzyme required for sulfatase activity/serine/threonine protein kinase